MTEQVWIDDAAADECQEAFLVKTPGATYYYPKFRIGMRKAL